MITNEFSFSGALGKSHNIGGSKFLSVPNTIEVPPLYSIDTGIPAAASFVTCSLDGRLWVYRRSRRLYIVALKFNEDTEKLDFATSQTINNGNIISRGLDWILTDKYMFTHSDSDPYLQSVNLFDDNSALSSSIEDTPDFCYSTLPAVGDFQIVENLFIPRCANGKKITSFLPIEYDAYSGYDFNSLIEDNSYIIKRNFQFSAHNGQIWARGHYSFGRVFILPVIFDEFGNIEKFSIYIRKEDFPDFVDRYLSPSETINEWSDVAPVFLGDNLRGYVRNSSNFFCGTSDNTSIYVPETKEWISLSVYNGKLFFNHIHSRGLLIDDEGINFLHNNNARIDCKALRQWITPTDDIDAITDNLVVTHSDNFSLITHLSSGFFREKLSAQTLPLTSCSYSGKRFSMGDNTQNNNKIITVNEIPLQETDTNTIAWEDIYRSHVNVNFIQSLEVDDLFNYHSWKTCYDVDGNAIGLVPIKLKEKTSRYYVKEEYIIQNGMDYSGAIVYYGHDPTGVIIPDFRYLGTNAEAGIIEGGVDTYTFEYFNHNKNTLSEFSIDVPIYVEVVNRTYTKSDVPDPYWRVYYSIKQIDSYGTSELSKITDNGEIFFEQFLVKKETDTHKYFDTVSFNIPVPEVIAKYLQYPHVKKADILPDSVIMFYSTYSTKYKNCYVFFEPLYRTCFILKINSSTDDTNLRVGTCFGDNDSQVLTSEGEYICTRTIYIMFFKTLAYIYKIEINPNINELKSYPSLST